jgi:Leucine Rich repeat
MLIKQIKDNSYSIFKAIKHNPNTALESLNLKHNRISDEIASKIAKDYFPYIPSIKKLNLGANFLGPLVYS